MAGPARAASRPSGRRLAALALVALPLVSAAQAAEDDDRGRALYENHCGECHAAAVHERENRKVDTREALHGWVAAMGAHAGLDWGAEEVDSVTRYLSRHVYGFTR